MAETYEINSAPIKSRLLKLYLDTCINVSTLRTHINSKHYSEARYTFQTFRINLSEMYYLSLSIEKLQEETIIKKIGSWSKVKCGQRCSIKFILLSISLFEEYAELLSGGFFNE